jgi:hypothetical protein
MTISRSLLIRMRNVSDKICRENQNTTYMFITFPPKSCLLYGNVEKYGRMWQATDDNITRRISIAWWIPKATYTHSEYVIIIAFSLQQCFRERASLLRSTYIVCCFVFWQFTIHVQSLRRDAATSTFTSHMGGYGFEFQSADMLSWPKLFVVLSSTCVSVSQW